jgi:hypothetical protein
LRRLFPGEAQVDPPQLLRALVDVVARSGITVKSGVTVFKRVPR